MPFVGPISGSIPVTGSLSIGRSPINLGSNIILTVSGSTDGTADSVFTGDAVVSGTLGTSGLRVLNVSKSANFNFGDSSFVCVNTISGPITGTLQGINHTNVGQMITVKDSGGYCSSNSFVFNCSGSEKIDGASELKISASSGSITLASAYDGSAYNWFIVGAT